MENERQTCIREKKRLLMYGNGKIYFSNRMERKFYFVLTIMMLISGILIHTGVFN